VKFEVECGHVRNENKDEIIMGIHPLNLPAENNSKGDLKPSQKDHLPINATCVGLLA
jgi:hypothetical protein